MTVFGRLVSRFFACSPHVNLLVISSFFSTPTAILPTYKGNPMSKVRILNLRPDRPDHRDLRMTAMSPASAAALPSVVSLRRAMPGVYNQKRTGSCTGNAISGLVHYQEIKQGRTNSLIPSRLFIYFNERLIEGTTDSDEGAMIRDGIKALVNYGFCFEDLWPFSESTVTTRPTPKAYQAAKRHRIEKYMRVEQTLASLKKCLADAHPIVTGITIYESFQDQDMRKTGKGKLPEAGEKIDGGHAVLIVGYNDHEQTFELRNSWGEDWGDEGYFTLPYAYILNPKLAQDFWTIYFTA